MYKNFVFDLYGTLVDIHTNEHESSAWEKLSETLSFYGLHYTPSELSETYFSSCEFQMRQGKDLHKNPEVDVVEVFRHIFENKGKKAGKSLATHLAQQFRAFSTDYIRLYGGVLETLTKLKKAGKKMYLLANAQSCFAKTEVANLGLRKYFKGIVYSSDYKCAKPDVALFNTLLDKYKLDRKETVMIGNDVATDVEGARNAKIDCLWLKTNLTKENSAKIAPKYVISDGNFTEVTKLLAKK